MCHQVDGLGSHLSLIYVKFDICPEIKLIYPEINSVLLSDETINYSNKLYTVVHNVYPCTYFVKDQQSISLLSGCDGL